MTERLADLVGAAAFSEVGGRLRMEVPAGTGRGGWRSWGAVSFRDDAVTVDVAVALPSTDPGSETSVELRLDPSDFATRIGMFVSEGDLIMQVREPAGILFGDTVAYDALAHRWWRMVESAGTTSFQVSPDGAAWSTIASTDTPVWATGSRST